MACSKEEPPVISILGDSISTFEGYIPEEDGVNLKHTARYPQEDLVMEVEETWWMQVIGELDAVLGVNDSWSASMVYNDLDENGGSFGPDSCMASMTRIRNLGANGDPDLILFYGGTNDTLHLVPLGEFDPAAEGRPVAAEAVDLTATKWETFAEAYETAILRLSYCYPEAQILAMLPTYAIDEYYTAGELAQYNAVMSAICEAYEIPYVDLRKHVTTTQLLPDGIHPSYQGMDLISEAVIDALDGTFPTT
ncbi:MAG: hypothetical protein J6S45_07640 [Firmicutes bacterium]|nr:hypothetical protein [Bacillota bacterium]